MTEMTSMTAMRRLLDSWIDMVYSYLLLQNDFECIGVAIEPLIRSFYVGCLSPSTT